MRRLLLGLFSVMALISQAFGVSDTDVHLIKVESVKIEEDKITIVASARVWMVVLVDGADKDAITRQYGGQPADWIKIRLDKATFVIRKPELDPKDGWAYTVQNAKDLKAGKEVGRIGYYQPKVVIEEGRVTSVDGRAFLYGKGK